MSLKANLDYFTQSALALLWLLLPVLAMLFCHALVNIDAPLFLDPISEGRFLGEYWDTIESLWVLISGIVAVGVNLLFLIIIPCLFGGQGSEVKHRQFLAGFIANLIPGIGLPLFYYFVYGLDNVTMWAELFPLYLVAFPATFIAGSRFISPAFRKGFWF
jgi:hypothetical protein